MLQLLRYGVLYPPKHTTILSA